MSDTDVLQYKTRNGSTISFFLTYNLKKKLVIAAAALQTEHIKNPDEFIYSRPW